jgi:4-diphosphocytidyl-2-C-methyl-D-erythritol kinase
MRGRGEVVEPLPALPALARSADGSESDDGGLALVVAVPPFGLSTPAVYRAWDDLGGPSSTRAVPTPAALAGLGLPGELVNDLEPAAEHVEPRLRPFRESLEALAGGPALLAGSGSAYVVAVGSAAQAAVVATQAGVELRALAFASGLAARGVEAQRSPD